MGAFPWVPLSLARPKKRWEEEKEVDEVGGGSPGVPATDRALGWSGTNHEPADRPPCGVPCRAPPDALAPPWKSPHLPLARMQLDVSIFPPDQDLVSRILTRRCTHLYPLPPTLQTPPLPPFAEHPHRQRTTVGPLAVGPLRVSTYSSSSSPGTFSLTPSPLPRYGRAVAA